MDKIDNDIYFQLEYIKERIKYLEKNYEGNLKKILLLNDDIKKFLDDKNNKLDDFEIDEKDNIELDNEISERIEENINVNKLLKVFSPFILLYQLNKTNT